jgi:hypothetical protein
MKQHQTPRQRRTSTQLIAFAAALLAMVTLVNPVAAHSGPASSPHYPGAVILRIQQVSSGLCVAISNAEVGQPAVLADCSKQLDRVFINDFNPIFNPDLELNPICRPWPGGCYVKYKLFNGACLSDGGAYRDGSAVTAAPCTTARDNEITWSGFTKPVGQPINHYVVGNRKTCLDAPAGRTGAAVIFKSCNGAASQEFAWYRETDADSPTTTVLSQIGSSLCGALDHNRSGAPVILADCAPSEVDRGWYLIGDANAVRFQLPNRLCLGVSGPLVQGGSVTGLPCSAADKTQTWWKEMFAPGKYRLRNFASDTYLDTADASTALYAKLVIGSYTGSTSQLWSFTS